MTDIVERRQGMTDLISTVACQGVQIKELAKDISEINIDVKMIASKLNNGLTAAVKENTEWRLNCQQIEAEKKIEQSKRRWDLVLAVGVAIAAPILLKLIIP